MIEIFIQYTNIFFITGIIYLVLALLKKLNMKIAGYAIIGATFSIAEPFLCGTPVGVPVIGYIVKLLIGEADFVSFTPLYFLSYELFGIVFGRILRYVRDKARFYKALAVPSMVVVLVWWVLVFVKYGLDLPEMFAAFSNSYTHPSLWHVVASVAHIFIFAIIFFMLGEARRTDGKLYEPGNPVAKQLLYYSRHISKYYAMHVTVYFVVLGLHGYEGFQSYQCWLLALLSIIVTELMVRGYNYLYEKIRKKAGR